MPMRRFVKVVQSRPAIAVAIALGIAIASGAVAQEPRRGGTLTVVLNNPPSSLLNQIEQGIYLFPVGAKVNEPLIDVDANWEFKPRLATAWKVSPDGLTWTFTLRQGVKWQDGKPFTPADVAWNMENVWKKVWASPALEAVASSEVSGADTVVFRLSRPVSPDAFLAMLSQRTYVLAPQGFSTANLRESPENRKPTGTGPFRVTEFVSGQYVILDRNPDYWDQGKPYLDRIVYKLMTDPNARTAALQAGQLDLVPFGSLPISEIDAAKRNPKLAVSSKGLDGNVFYTGLVFNLLNQQTGNQKVRYAIAHAVDLRKFVDFVFLGQGKPMGTPFPDTSRYFAADVPRYEYSIAKANALLDEAGFPRGRNGERFALTMVGSSGNIGVTQRASQFISQSLKEIGIAVNAQIPDMATYLRLVYRDRTFDLSLYTAGYLVDPCVATMGWYTSEAFRSGGTFRNHSGLQDPQLDAAAERSCTALNPQERAESLKQFQRLANGSLSILNLIQEDRPNVFVSRLKNVGEGSVNWHYSSFKDLWFNE